MTVYRNGHADVLEFGVFILPSVVFPYQEFSPLTAASVCAATFRFAVAIVDGGSRLVKIFF
jgi:hypothetical protein